MKIAVVILNWNGEDFLRRFLPNVIENSREVAEVIVADNASTDHSLDFLHKNFPQIRTIVLSENFGFAGGYNQALKQVDADYYVLLNSDIEVSPQWIPPVIQLMESDEKIAVCQPKIRSYHDKTHFEYAGAAGGFIDRFGYPFCRGRVFDTLELDHGQYEDTREIFWATGAALFIKAKLFHQYGGFDADFFAHMEEIDLCWRIKNAGYKVMYCPQSVIYHIGGGTLPKSSPHKTYLNFRNNLFLLYKNLPEKNLHEVLFLRLFLDALAALRFLFDSPAESWAVVRAYRDFIRDIDNTRNKRKAINPINYPTTVYRPSLVWDYFVNKKKHFSQLNSNDFNL